MQENQLVENNLKDWGTMDTLSNEVSHTHALKTTDFLGARRFETVE